MPNPGELSNGLQPTRLSDFGNDSSSNPYVNQFTPAQIQAAFNQGVSTGYTTSTGAINNPSISIPRALRITDTLTSVSSSLGNNIPISLLVIGGAVLLFLALR